MDTKLFHTDDNEIAEAGEILRNGGLVAFPTETVYGLGASAFDSDAAKKIYAAKGRPSDNPLIVHICDKGQIKDIAEEIPESAKKVIDNFMPGPVTIILKKKSVVPNDVTAGLNTVAIRFPLHETAQKLIKAAGVPIAAPSANLSGKPSPTKAKHVVKDMTGRIDAIIDGGECNVGVESTIVDFTGEKPVILRPGGVTYDDLKGIGLDVEIDKNILHSIAADEVPKCPGMKYKHYAPNAEVTVVEGEKDAVQSKIKELLEQCKNAKPEVMQACMKEILLLGTYIKRSANLYFLSQEYEKLPQQELRLTIDELVRAMNSCKIECGAVYLTTKPIASKEVVRLFELLKTVMEMTINELHSLFISVSDQEMNLSVECAADLSPIISSEVTVDKEDGLWLIRTAIGGEDNA